MIRNRAPFLLVLVVLLFAIVLLAQSANETVQAEPVVTPTLAANSWSFLPVIRRLNLVPPATATVPGPTQTASPTFTSTPTNTPEPGRLASPTLFDILNDDHDGNFKVSWSTVHEVEYFRLQQKRNSDSWKQLYEGPERELSRSNLADGQYCYRVMALNAISDSEWSAIKCASVINATNTPMPTNTPPPGLLAAPIIYDIENSDKDGNYGIQWNSVPGAEWYKLKENFNNTTWDPKYEGPDTSFSRNSLPAGEYCYRVRAFNTMTHSEWSEDKCTIVNSVTDNFSCSFEIVGRIAPGISGHQMTFLRDKNIVVITGGLSYEQIENERYGEYKDQNGIYVYDVETKRLHYAGTLTIPRSGHVAIPLDDYRVLLTGGGKYWVDPEHPRDEIVHIEHGRDGAGYSAYTTTRSPDIYYARVSEMIDDEHALVIEGSYDFDYQNIVIYDVVTGQVQDIARTDDIYPYTLHRMSKESNKFLSASWYLGVIVDINLQTINTFAYPTYQWPEESELNIFSPNLTPLNEDAILFSNGWCDDLGDWGEYALDHAYIYNGAGEKRRIDDTNHRLFSRVVLRAEDGHVVLVSGYESSYYIDDDATGSEVFDPETETFHTIDGPHSAHANGQAVGLADGYTFLIAGGFDDYFLDDDSQTDITTADLVELVTCK